VEHEDGRLEIIDVEQLLNQAAVEIKRLQQDTVELDSEAALELSL
jgi:hypothetical protein